jgi:hypothetical protein
MGSERPDHPQQVGVGGGTELGSHPAEELRDAGRAAPELRGDDLQRLGAHRHRHGLALEGREGQRGLLGLRGPAQHERPALAVLSPIDDHPLSREQLVPDCLRGRARHAKPYRTS